MGRSIKAFKRMKRRSLKHRGGNVPIIHHDTLDQNVLCLTIKENGHVVIGNNNCLVNACLYFALNNIVNNFSNDPETIITLINSLIDQGVIKAERKYFEYVDITEDTMREFIKKYATDIVFVTVRDNNVEVVLSDYEQDGYHRYMPITNKNPNNNKVNIPYDHPLPWKNNTLSIIANVQGLKQAGTNDATITMTPDHYIAIKIDENENKIEIADSFHPIRKYYDKATKVPIDRLHDPMVKKIIDTLRKTKPNNDRSVAASSNSSHIDTNPLRIPPIMPVQSPAFSVSSIAAASSNAMDMHIDEKDNSSMIPTMLVQSPAAAANPIDAAIGVAAIGSQSFEKEKNGDMVVQRVLPGAYAQSYTV